MGIKKRQKVSAQFSMSSLTDIIFLLLIFFMLTSSLVAPNSINMKMPSSRTTVPPSSERPDDIRIDSRGQYFLNGKKFGLTSLEGQLKRMRGGKNITISPSGGAPIESVATAMDMVKRAGHQGVLTAEVD